MAVAWALRRRQRRLPLQGDIDLGRLMLLLIPLAALELALLVFALRDLIRREKVAGGNKWLWGAIILLFNFIGPVLYFAIGRKE